MRSEKIMKSKIYRFLDYAMRLVLINFIIAIISFSLLIIFMYITKDYDDIPGWLSFLALVPTILTLFPAILAGFDVIKQYEEGLTNTVFKDYFKSFKKFYLKALLLGIVIIIIALLLYNSYQYFLAHYSESIANIVGFYLTISCSVILIFMLAHLPLVMVYFEGLTMRHYLSLSLIMAFKDVVLTFLMMVIVMATILLGLLWNWILIFGGFSLPIYAIIKMTYKKYKVIST